MESLCIKKFIVIQLNRHYAIYSVLTWSWYISLICNFHRPLLTIYFKTNATVVDLRICLEINYLVLIVVMLMNWLLPWSVISPIGRPVVTMMAMELNADWSTRFCNAIVHLIQMPMNQEFSLLVLITMGLLHCCRWRKKNGFALTMSSNWTATEVCMTT